MLVELCVCIFDFCRINTEMKKEMTNLDNSAEISVDTQISKKRSLVVAFPETTTTTICTLQSGGARGADSEFAVVAKQHRHQNPKLCIR